MKTIGYADDVAVVGTHVELDTLTDRMNQSLELLRGWLADNGLCMAPEKTEAIVLRFGRPRTDVTLTVAGRRIAAVDNIKYLGITLNSAMTFGPHIDRVAKKAEGTARALLRIMPNLGGPKFSRRRILAASAMSIMLYGAPVWAGAMAVAKYRRRLLSVQRSLALRICCGYRTVSTEAALVLSGSVPIHLLAMERRRIWLLDGRDPASVKACRQQTIREWQAEWTATANGAWTRRLIPVVSDWLNRKHGDLTYYLTQALSGHGSFGSYLNRIGKAADPSCKYCGDPMDDAEHTLFACTRWEETRTEIAHVAGGHITADNLIPTMLGNAGGWRAIEAGIVSIIKTKEEDERR